MTEYFVVPVVRVLASLAACALFASLFPDIRHVHQQKSTASMPSALPVLSMVANCVAWGLYGVLIDDYFPLVGTNMVGLGLSLFYLAVYYYYASNKARLSLEILATTGLLVGLVLYPFVAAMVGVSDETVQHIVGYLTVTTSLVMFGSPLVLVKRVLRERNTNLLPVTMITVGAITCALWLGYGLLLEDAFIIVPNAANLLLGVVQFALFCMYPRGATPDLQLKIDYDKSARSTTVKKEEEEEEEEKEDSTTGLKTDDERSSSEEEVEWNDFSAPPSTTRETTIEVR